jgi:hypothetical protein
MPPALPPVLVPALVPPVDVEPPVPAVVVVVPAVPVIGPGVLGLVLHADTAKTAVKEPARAKGAVFLNSWRELLAGICS